MAGFEVVVRPVVFPNIRPAPAQPVSPQDDPEKGFAVIHGNGGKMVSMSYSYSASGSTSSHRETKRRVDEARIYQKDKDGKVNKENFVDIEIANKIWKSGSAKQEGDPIPSEENFLRPGERKLNERWVEYYKRIEEADNIEIMKKDQIRKRKEGEK